MGLVCSAADKFGFEFNKMREAEQQTQQEEEEGRESPSWEIRWTVWWSFMKRDTDADKWEYPPNIRRHCLCK